MRWLREQNLFGLAVNWRRLLGPALKGLLYLATFVHTMPFFVRVSSSLLENFFSSSVSFNLDTIYVNWNTSFPAITVCELYNGEKLWDLSEIQFGVEHDMHIDDFVSEIVFFHGICSSCEKCETLSCPDNFTLLLEVFRSKCHELIIECSYRNQLFDCCEQFLPIHTEYGVCYSFNSHQARKVPHVQYTNNRMTGAAHLNFIAAADIQLHVHAPIDVPFHYSEGMIRETVLRGNFKELVLNVIEVYNHESVLDLTMDQRRCRYAHERTNISQQVGIYEFYSYSGCVVECTVALQLRHCNCTSHFMAVPSKNSLPVCDHRGLKCLSYINEQLHIERKSCDCMSSCDEPEYNIIYNSADNDKETEEEVSHIRVALVELPTQRYVRRVAKTNLDLLISVGGLVSLFFNTSALRIVEALFLFVEYRKVLCKWPLIIFLGTRRYLHSVFRMS
ncbi:pickpocket protein 19 [Scaptodrosophila lebanonensis]|uniref:Pickpocket protein 19 n=1 Tax=Drosophila lebanonensis TaxID=7225 RepID=A0A6J2T4D5_DROLE|nr:pickpocket protein 19 [Scaptodrosophila lebanonensis]